MRGRVPGVPVDREKASLVCRKNLVPREKEPKSMPPGEETGAWRGHTPAYHISSNGGQYLTEIFL